MTSLNCLCQYFTYDTSRDLSLKNESCIFKSNIYFELLDASMQEGVININVKSKITKPYELFKVNRELKGIKVLLTSITNINIIDYLRYLGMFIVKYMFSNIVSNFDIVTVDKLFDILLLHHCHKLMTSKITSIQVYDGFVKYVERVSINNNFQMGGNIKESTESNSEILNTDNLNTENVDNKLKNVDSELNIIKGDYINNSNDKKEYSGPPTENFYLTGYIYI